MMMMTMIMVMMMVRMMMTMVTMMMTAMMIVTMMTAMMTMMLMMLMTAPFHKQKLANFALARIGNPPRLGGAGIDMYSRAAKR